MKLTKFERRKQEILKKHEEELQALVEAERKEREKLLDPIVDKISKVAGEEARKILEKNPEYLETYSFRKREAGKALATSLEALFTEVEEEQVVSTQKPEPTPSIKPAMEVDEKKTESSSSFHSDISRD